MSKDIIVLEQLPVIRQNLMAIKAEVDAWSYPRKSARSLRLTTNSTFPKKRNYRRCGRTDGLDDKMQYKDIALLL